MQKLTKQLAIMIFIIGLCVAQPVTTIAQNLSLEEFEAYAIQAKEADFTHVKITYDIPLSTWQFDTPDDPYPTWYVFRPSLLKIFPPKKLQPYMDMEYAQEIIDLFKVRIEILRRHDLKAFYRTNEPHVLPEAFFEDYPMLRGPRVDQVNRSRTARFAPCLDQPEVLEMYKEAMQNLLEELPEVEVFSFVTTDSGSGICWTHGLYPGVNGPAHCEHRPMADRIQGFMNVLNEGAEAAGEDIQINLYGISPREWMLPTFEDPKRIAEGLPEGFSLDGYKNSGDRIKWRRPSDGYEFNPPILGIPNPLGIANGIMEDLENSELGVPLAAKFPLIPGLDFKFQLQQKLQKASPRSSTEMKVTLREFASELAGEDHADDLMTIWESIYSSAEHLDGLNFGPIFRMGNLFARWVNRPMVPFPEELTEEEKGYYHLYLFQAKREEQANNLIDTQAMRMYEGYGARLLVQRVTELALSDLEQARQAAARLIEGASSESQEKRWILLDKRLAVAESFIHSADNMVGYQALLELAKNDGNEPEPNPVLGARGSWKRQELIRLARNEIENAAKLRKLLLSSEEPLIYTAPTPEMESIMTLSPDLPDQLKKKIDIMNRKWQDYKRLFTQPNP
ncbi:MAG: hypothetical protein WD059_01405 [Balneolaceae bacterium]